MQDPELLEKIRQQFDSAPYPNTPLETNPINNYEGLFIHSLATPYYLKHQKFLDTHGKVILDAGCGTGYKSLVLAMANPGAKIVGIDLSEQSVDLAQKRLQYHGINNAEFHVLRIEDLPHLEMQFDYINCDEVLYLFPDIAAALQVMKSVLAPEGIIRGNLHSALQRTWHFRAQQLFTLMGLMDSNPEDLEIEIALDTMRALKDNVELKTTTFKPSRYEGNQRNQAVLMNYLFQGDKGYTIPELFTALEKAQLDFISMVNWRQWELLDLFREPDNLPAFWAMSLPELSMQQRLHIFELLQPCHRLLDFWCSQPTASTNSVLVTDWQDTDWENATVHLHPVLRTQVIENDLLEATAELSPFNIGAYGIKTSAVSSVEIEIGMASCLLMLWEGGQPISAFVDRYLTTRPLNLITLEPVTREDAFAQVKRFLITLETFLYVLLER